jgi:hypothetical protein
MSYQFVVRNAGGELVTNQGIGVKISILQGSTTGTVIYQELFNPNPQSNANGLVSIEIGTGIPISSGAFSDIDWSVGPYFLKTETDPTGATNYTVVGTSELLSVPYALYSEISGDVADNSITSSKILDGTIATADLGNSTVTSAKIADGSVAIADLAANSVNGTKIVDLGIGTVDLADGSVTSGKIADGNIATADLANGAVTTAKINNTGASADNVLQYTGSSVAWDYAPGAEIKYTVLNVTCNTAVPVNTTYSKVTDIGSFSKLASDSRIEVTFFGRLQVATFEAGTTGAIFELRVDNNASPVGRARATLKDTDAGYRGIQVSMSGIFPGLLTGTHTVSVWVRTFYGTGTEVRVDPGCWQSDHVIVREIK